LIEDKLELSYFSEERDVEVAEVLLEVELLDIRLDLAELFELANDDEAEPTTELLDEAGITALELLELELFGLELDLDEELDLLLEDLLELDFGLELDFEELDLGDEEDLELELLEELDLLELDDFEELLRTKELDELVVESELDETDCAELKTGIIAIATETIPLTAINFLNKKD
jgi:hypothetical protein